MEKEVRNRIQRATQAARKLLETEFAEQLEGTFDIRLDGTIAAEPGHLSSEQRVLRRKLIVAVEHRHEDGLELTNAVATYLRESAFTTLNRFVALKMLEARGLVQECVTRGENSSGFNEFKGLAPGFVSLLGNAYRIYIESLFDEIGREVQVLFDLRDPASLLWPRRAPLLQLLIILNESDLSEVWAEDDTIGWVYQYFNSDEERRKMRSESQAPRASRELAVRNQFFTPRYVVEFLTDNTLGRIWYEMRQGQSRIVETSSFLIRRPNEIFLAGNEEAPLDNANDNKPTHEEPLDQPTYIPFRARKDPRELKVLDPACGSGHFLLYAFDLFLTIYEESWSEEADPPFETSGKTLREDYPSIDAMRRAIPCLILQHNLFGIDIDPRATQIAALTLWMRAQRAYRDLDVLRETRAKIDKTRIVVAESLPVEQVVFQDFTDRLDQQLKQLFKRVFRAMRIAGEAGSLLKIENEINTAIRDIYGDYGELFQASDEERWCIAENNLLAAINTYAEQARGGKRYSRRLFAADAAQGFAFIDLCRQNYDVVLMNPPFGEAPIAARDSLYQSIPVIARDIFAGFVERFSEN